MNVTLIKMSTVAINLSLIPTTEVKIFPYSLVKHPYTRKTNIIK